MIRYACRLTISALLLAAHSASAADTEFNPEQIEFFENKVRPLLVERCHKCHGPDEQEAGLRLDSRATILKGGDTGPAIVPGKPDESELVRAIRYGADGYQMPPDGKLPEAEIAILTRWVEMGAPWPDDETDITHAGDEFNLEERAKRWSFQPLERPAVPSVIRGPSSVEADGTSAGVRHHFVDSTNQPQRARTNEMVPDPSSWCRNPIDRFILAKLLEKGLTSTVEADRSTLIRRTSFDVLGLPPSQEQVRAFVDGNDPDAYERLIDELLASPHFGERWGRHWLDLVRYAESRGHEFDHNVANAHQYRDYVIRALNADVPYDQFVVEHVAGDLLTDQTDHRLRLEPMTGANESILGTGFWFLGEWVHSPVDIRADEAERFANMIDVYSKTFLGLTVACARCHDHKFDPITTQDYYALQAYLQSSHYRQARFETMEHNRRIAVASEALFLKAQRAILPVYQKLVNAAVDELPEYLLAARHVLQAPEPFGGELLESLTAEALHESVGPIAEAHELDPVTLAAWVRHLPVAADDITNPFHLWGKVCTGELADPVAVRAYDAGEFGRERLEEERVVEEKSYLSPFDRVFLGNVDLSILAGNVLPLTEDPNRPYLRFETFIHQRNPLMTDMNPAADADAEPGAAGHRRSVGTTLRTDTFEICKDNLYFRVRGDCSVYVAVDSHILIKGPLHGQLFSDHPVPEGAEDTWRWITIDVSRYRGHRAHVELLPHAGRPFSLDGVWQRDSAPPEERKRSWPRSWSANTNLATFTTFETLAETLADAFEEIDSLGPHFIAFRGWESTLGHTLDAAAWVVTHPALFGLDRPESRRMIADVSKPFIHEMQQLQRQVRTISAIAPTIADGSTEVEYVFIRGNWEKPGELVAPQFVEVFDGNGTPVVTDGSGRRELAQHMVDPAKTPILPRVIVNRIWQHYFGVGIVPTPDDFGYMGQEPSHQELLDWLACELVESGWSMKHIHRLVLTSATYRMGSGSVVRGPWSVGTGMDSRLRENDGQLPLSTLNPQPATMDPNNRLLSHQNVKRLEGEAIRDAMLAVSGRLDERMYGRSVPVHLTPFMEGRGRPEESGPVDGAGRRSIYIAVRRNFPEPFFQAFDFPNPHTTTGRRSVSNVPAQALAMMNNPLVIGEARRWGERIIAERPTDVESRIRRLYQSAFSRLPSEAELTRGRDFLTSHADGLGRDVDSAEVWADYCHTLLNTKEFFFIR